MFSKILIANRGEIAVRIIRACKEMGVATVAVYSEADKNALHVALADQSYCIGGPEASESYLNENQIIRTAILAIGHSGNKSGRFRPGSKASSRQDRISRNAQSLCRRRWTGHPSDPLGR